MKEFQIDIVSDIACPWCAIGLARLEQAMVQLGPEYAFTLAWRAFELNPDHGEEGEPILPALARKYGRSEEEMRAGQAQMMSIASALGINFDQLQERFTCNTFDAHRLVKWAAEHGRQTDMKKALFEAYFGRGKDVSSHDVLIGCAETLGLDTSEAGEILESKRYASAVRDDEAGCRRAGINAVPAFIVNRHYLISGAQEADTLVQTLREIGQ